MTVPPTVRALPLAALALLAACRTWRPAGDAPGGAVPGGVAQAIVAASGPAARPVRLTTSRGEAVVLTNPWVERDSVVGAEGRSRARRAVALADVEAVEAWRVSTRRTLAAVAAGALVVAAAAYAALAAFVAGNV